MTCAKMKNRCLACGSELSGPLFTLDNMPLGAQAMPDREGLSSDAGITLPLCRCPVCGLTQFDCEPVDYYRDAIRVVGLSKTMRDLRRADYQYLIDNYGLAGKKWLECGCGNGDFLKVLSEFPVDIYGTEAGSANVSAARSGLAAAGIDASHIQQFFPENADMEIAGAPFDCFLSFNFLEHQPDPRSMLGCIRKNLADGGIGLITVPSFEYILNHGRYYELVRDHIANYDLNSLEHLVTDCGFEVLEKGFIGIGDTLRMVVRKPDSRNAAASAAAGFSLPSEEMNEKIRGLADNYREMSEEIAGYMGDLRRKGRSIGLWGAGHQGFTIASTTALKDYAEYILDSSEKKQGLFAPASHLEIVAPEHYFENPVDVIMIAAPGYIREIEQTIREKYSERGVGPGVPAICDVLDITER